MPAPEGGFKGPAVLTIGYMGHMWELYAFWGWIGPFLVANLVNSGFTLNRAVSLGGIGASMVIAAGAMGVWMAGSISDRMGRIKVVIAVSICSIFGNAIYGFTFGRGLATVALLGIWIGFWSIADSGIYKAALTEMTSPGIRGTALGIQSAIGYLPTVIAPVVFGKLLQIYNPGINDLSNATDWRMSFLVLGVGAILAPVCMLWLIRIPQARLINNKKQEI
jgi:MFS family permease